MFHRCLRRFILVGEAWDVVALLEATSCNGQPCWVHACVVLVCFHLLIRAQLSQSPWQSLYLSPSHLRIISLFQSVCLEDSFLFHFSDSTLFIFHFHSHVHPESVGATAACIKKGTYVRPVKSLSLFFVFSFAVCLSFFPTEVEISPHDQYRFTGTVRKDIPE